MTMVEDPGTMRSALEPMKAERVQARVLELPGWEATTDSRAIVRTYIFPSSEAALRFAAFVNQVGQELGHHPEIRLRSHRLTVTATTDEAGGVTPRDFDLAEIIDNRR